MKTLISRSLTCSFIILFLLFSLFLSGCNKKMSSQSAQNIVLKGGKHYSLAGISGLQIDSKGNIYVFDSVNPRILKFDKSGHYLGLVLGKQNKSQAIGAEFSAVSISPAIAKLSDSLKSKLMHKLK